MNTPESIPLKIGYKKCPGTKGGHPGCPPVSFTWISVRRIDKYQGRCHHGPVEVCVGIDKIAPFLSK